ncbi:hypothetical protein D3C80_2125760 [compost metagenome]
MYHIQILLLVVATDIVGFTDTAGCYHGVQRTGMILHIEPVADLVAFTINGQRFAIQSI